MLVAAVALHVVMLASLRTEWLNPLFNDTRNRPGPAADFFSVFHAGWQVRTGLNPYHHEESPSVTPPHFAPFRYPPGVAYTIGFGFAQVRPWAAYLIWLLVLEALLLANLWGIRFVIEDVRARTIVRCAWLLFTPFYVELWMGQFTFFAASLVFWAVIAWQRQRARIAAAGWAIACAVKLFPLALAPMLLRRRRFGALAGAVVALALAMVWFIGRGDDLSGFMSLNFSRPQIAELHAGNLGLHALVYETAAWGGHISGADWAPWSRALSLVIALVAAVAMFVPRDPDDRVSAAIALLLLPLVAKDAWEHYYVVVLPALTFLVAAWRTRPRMLAVVAAVFAVIALPTWLVLLQGPASVWYPSAEWSPLATALYHAPKPLAVLALVAVAVVDAMRGGAYSSATSSARRASVSPGV